MITKIAVKKPSTSFPNVYSPYGIFMLIYAACLDIVSLVPVLNVVFGIIGTVTLGFWSWIHSPKLPFLKKLLHVGVRQGGVSIIEIIPGISMLPTWTLYVLIRLKKK
jgi:hypothetical protein